MCEETDIFLWSHLCYSLMIHKQWQSSYYWFPNGKVSHYLNPDRAWYEECIYRQLRGKTPTLKFIYKIIKIQLVRFDCDKNQHHSSFFERHPQVTCSLVLSKCLLQFLISLSIKFYWFFYSSQGDRKFGSKIP